MSPRSVALENGFLVWGKVTTTSCSTSRKYSYGTHIVMTRIWSWRKYSYGKVTTTSCSTSHSGGSDGAALTRAHAARCERHARNAHTRSAWPIVGLWLAGKPLTALGGGGLDRSWDLRAIDHGVKMIKQVVAENDPRRL